MSELDPEKLSVRFFGNAAPEGPLQPRRYTLTHSDTTGDLYLTIGTDYDRKQTSGLYTRIMRDEVLAEWRENQSEPVLVVICHVSGGLVFGSPGWRYSIFQNHLRLVLEAFRYGDAPFFQNNPQLDKAPIQVHFHAKQPRYKRVEHWGTPFDYINGEQNEFFEK